MSEDLSSCTSLIAKHFQLPDEELDHRITSESELELKLASIINSFLNQDMTRLLNAFYKIDLDEAVFRRILATEPSDNIGLTLAREVIKRELQKVKIRKKYRNT